ncbi:excinuclease ABC subunit C [Chromatiales bacterium (ex Bugula neritina AB1)]|nr:excinuclease ABC subunit C [Chromatiales bacterium (ex Bugula neritina AB1)]
MSSEGAPPFDSVSFLKTVTQRPGVYQMLNASGETIYVGKAGNLKKRVSSYFLKDPGSAKTRVMVAHIAGVELTVTSNEIEALLLENNLIKEKRPRYNILLRDDKSYPFLFVSTEEAYPRISYRRGGRKQAGKYIGPYPHAGAVKKTLRYIQKLFKVRQCEDSYFRNRSRPCLQYQINRCTAPCVGLVDEENYRRDVNMTIKVLEGRTNEVVGSLVSDMETASAQLQFERAASLRDQIKDLKAVNQTQYVENGQGDMDVVACHQDGGQYCLQIFFVRNGVNLGNKAFFPSTPADSTLAEVVKGFLTQFYLQHEVPRRVITHCAIDEVKLIEEALRQKVGYAVEIVHNVRGEQRRWVENARENARLALEARLASRSGMAERQDKLRQLLELDELPQRMECFDISHLSGEATIASCVVFGVEGAIKSEYRRFQIKDITPGDDYAAMRQALTRRYTRLLKESQRIPEVLFIDGGKGQVGVALEVVEELQLAEIQVVGVAKGPERRPGEESLLICRTGSEIQMSHDSPALHLIQQIRDEAHRYAVAGHRATRGKARRKSVLEDIVGLGPKRRRSLLTHFGGLRALQMASVEDIANVPGISVQLAQLVYDFFHEQN